MLLILLSAPLGQAVFVERATLSGSEFRPRDTQIIILHCLQSVHSVFLCKNRGAMLERRHAKSVSWKTTEPSAHAIEIEIREQTRRHA